MERGKIYFKKCNDKRKVDVILLKSEAIILLIPSLTIEREWVKERESEKGRAKLETEKRYRR